MITKTFSVALQGIAPFLVEIEVNASGKGNETRVVIVGLPDTAVKESKERIRSAIFASGYKFPRGVTTVSLAPADVKKTGALFDLPIAVSIIASVNNLALDKLNKTAFVGELALDGSLRKINGALAMALELEEKGIKRLVVPQDNLKEASIASNIEVLGAKSLNQVIAYLNSEAELASFNHNLDEVFNEQEKFLYDFADVKGHQGVKRGLEVAAAGGHNALMLGAPGCGKSLLAKSYSSILPKLHLSEALEVTKIYSIAGLLPKDKALMVQRPFRSPHHTISDVGLLGGTSNLRPGEISLAHNGVLFLDELPEYRRSTLEVMRQPLEDKIVSIARATGSVKFPANFMLLGAMNPCPCGYLGSVSRQCRCSVNQISRYRSKISGPLLDRIDIHLEVQALTEKQMLQTKQEEGSLQIRQRVQRAKKIQIERFSSATCTNATMLPKQLKEFCVLDREASSLLKVSINELGLSARAYDRILKVARTIADLEENTLVQVQHIAEAINYRTLDRNTW